MGRLTTAPSTANDATYRFLWKLRQDVADLNIVVVGDSTGDETTEWVYLFTQWLAGQYPTYTVKYRLWSTNASTDYAASSTLQTGTGANTITMFNASISGTSEKIVLAPYFTAKVVTPAPDVIIESHGHNFLPIDANNTASQTRDKYFSMTETLRQAVPTAALICIAQNPETDNTYQATRMRELARVCEMRGYGFINVYQAFVDYGASWTTDLMANSVHPNAAGSAVWAAEVEKAFMWTGNRQPRPMNPSSFDEGMVQNLITNGDFHTFDGSTVPTGWTATNVTFSKDVTNYESANGWSVHMTPTTSGTATITYDVANYQAFKGKNVVVAARLLNNGGAANLHAGRIALDDGITTITSQQDQWGFGNYVWRVISLQLSASATRLRVTFYVADNTGTGIEDVSLDGVYLVPGIVPRKAAELAVGATGATGAAGGGVLDFLSTIGSNPAIACLSNSSLTLVTANHAQVIQVKPNRDMTITKLEWFTSGTGSTGNYDIAIYDNSGNRLWSKGSTAWPAAFAATVETVSPSVPLTAGTVYWIAFAGDNTTSTIAGLLSPSLSRQIMLDGGQWARVVASSFPLPNPITFGSTGTLRVPTILLREA